MVGASTGLLHGLFLLVAALPVLPYIHPRMASEYDGASAIKKLEPPGFMALNYGSRTPLTTLVGQAIYGAVLGGFPPARANSRMNSNIVYACSGLLDADTQARLGYLGHPHVFGAAMRMIKRM